VANPNEKNTPWSWLLTALTTSIFLIFWVACQWLIHWVFQNLPLEGLDAWVGVVLQIAFGAATITPVIIWLYRDFMIMFYRARRDVRKAKAESEGLEDTGR
jgi:hypothetical protein